MKYTSDYPPETAAARTDEQRKERNEKTSAVAIQGESRTSDNVERSIYPEA